MESNESWWTNIIRQKKEDSKQINLNPSEKTKTDKCMLNPELESEFTSPKEHKSRNQKTQNKWNHKTASHLDRGFNNHWESTQSDYNTQSKSVFGDEKIFSSLKLNKWTSKPNFAWSKSKSTNIFDSCLGSVRSEVPQNLISDANRRNQKDEKSNNKKTKGLLNNRKLDK